MLSRVGKIDAKRAVVLALVISVVALTLGLSMRAHDRFEVSPGSITTLTADTWGLQLHAMNEAPR